MAHRTVLSRTSRLFSNLVRSHRRQCHSLANPRRFACEPLEARIAPAATFSVIFTDPAHGAFVGAPPADVTVDFSSSVLPATLQASDLTINGIAASSFTVVDEDTVRFTLSGPLSGGTHTLAIGAGAIQDTQGTPIEAFSAQFTIDQTAPRVISSSIQPRGEVPAGDVTYVVEFDEPLATWQIDAGDFSLLAIGRAMSYAPAAFSFNEAGDTLRIIYPDLPDDVYQLTLLSGDGRFEDRAGNDLDGEIALGVPQPIVSGNGVAGGDFVLNFSADVRTGAFPSPLLPLLPAGSFVQQGSVVTYFNGGRDYDTYTIPLMAGQKLTVVVESESTVRAELTVYGPGGDVIGNSLAPAAGVKFTLQTLEAATSGIYRLSLENRTNSGFATMQVLLHAAAETESAVGGGNENRGTAQSIDGSFVNLGGNVSRGAVIGTTDFVAGPLPDEVEPNDTTSQANTAIANYVSFRGNVYQLALEGNRTANDTDFFYFGGMQAGDVLTISLAAAGGSRGTLEDPLVRLFRGSVAPVEVTSDDNGGSGADSLIYRFQITTHDTYYIAVSGFGSDDTGTYQLGVYLENSGAAPLTGGSFFNEREPNNSVSTATNVSTSWRPVQYLSRTSGTITAGDVDTYRYFFNAGDLVTVNIDATSSGLDARAALLDAGGAIIAAESGESIGPGQSSPIYAFRIPTSGIYFVQAMANTGTGSYNADVYLSPFTAPPASSGVDFYSFTLATGQTASIGIKALGQGALQIELQNAGGSTLAVGTAVAGNVDSIISQFVAPAGGTYYVRVTGSPEAPYSLVVVRNADFDAQPNDTLETAQPLGASGVVLGGITGSGTGDVDFYSVQVPEVGSTLVISARAPAASAAPLLQPILDLYDPSGALVASSGGGAAEIIFTTATAGTHTVQVRSEDGGGDYLLQVIGANAVNDAPILRATEPVSLSPIKEDDVRNRGTLVRDLIASGGENFIIDPDAGAVPGIAIIGGDTENGAWQFTTDGGATWTQLGAVSATSGRLLAADEATAIRFVPAADFHGEITGGLTFRAWDLTSGANGQLANITATGGGSSFSAGTAQAGITVASVNDAPVFTPGLNQRVLEDSGAHVVENWATGIAAGPANEAGQQVKFIVTTTRPEMFAVQPAVSPEGTLTYTLAPNAWGLATVAVALKDDGGTEPRGGGDTSAWQHFQIFVTPVNDAPVNTVPAAQQVRQGTPLVFSTKTGNAISIADIDAGGGFLDVRLEAASGVLTLGSTSGLIFTTGDGSADAALVFTGTLKDINAALDGLTYTPAAGFIGAASLQIITDDRGNRGGGSLVATSTIPITVTPVISFAKKFTYTDSQGNTVKLQLKGKGAGELWLSASGAGDPVAIVIDGSTAKTKLKITTERGAESSVGGFVVNGSLKSINAPKIDLTGDLTVSGTLRSVKLDDVTGSMISLRTDSSVKLGKNGKVSFKFDRVAETSIATNGLVIKSLRATEWQDNEGPRGEISAPAIEKLAISGSKKQELAGDFEAGLELTGSKKTGAEVLGAARISGGIMSEGESPIVWNLAGAAGKLRLGDVAGLEVNAGGFIGNVTADRWNSGALAAKSIALLAVTGGKSETRFPGGFGADLSLSGDLVSAVIGGGITGGVWTIGGNAALIVTRGIDAGWTAAITGNVGTVKVLQDASGSLTAAAMGAFKVGGDLLEASIIVHQPAIIDGLNLGNLGRVAIGGVMQDSSIDVSGSISSAKIGGMQDSRIFAGVRSGLTGLPELRSDFVASSQIAKLTVTAGKNAVFENSHIAAASLGSALVRGVQEDNGGVRFGIAADAIASLKVRYGAESAQPKSVSLNELSTAVIAEQRGDFIVRVV